MKHSKLLHVNNVNPTVSTNYANYYNNVNVSMPVVPIVANDTYVTHALLDTGSSSSFCTRRLVDKLQLKGSEISYRLRTLHGTADRHTETVDLKLSSEDGSESLLMKDVLVTEEIPVESVPPDVIRYSYLEGLSFSHSKGVDILIGQDNPRALVPLDVRKGLRDGPFATRTMFGWSLNGASNPSVTSRHVNMNFISVSALPLDNKVDKQWQIQEEGVRTHTEPLSWEDKKVLESKESHDELPIPCRDPDPTMPNDLNATQQNLQCLHASVERNCTDELYDEQVAIKVANNYAKQVQDEPAEQKKCWYLPTHAVTKKDEKSLKLVFDRAHVYRDTSLNSSCHLGPNLTSQLFDVPVQFSQYSHAVMADIHCMYKKSGYHSTSHLFRDALCSSVPSYALKKTPELTDDVIVPDMITQSFYVDDLAHSSPDPELLYQHVLELKHVPSTRGFTLTKFVATDRELLTGIVIEDRTRANAAHSPEVVRNTLGIGWCDKHDVLFIKSEVKSTCDQSEMLRFLASVGDPVDLISPILVRGRLLSQEAVRQQALWHEPFHPAFQRERDTWFLVVKNALLLKYKDKLCSQRFFCV